MSYDGNGQEFWKGFALGTLAAVCGQLLGAVAGLALAWLTQ